MTKGIPEVYSLGMFTANDHILDKGNNEKAEFHSLIAAPKNKNLHISLLHLVKVYLDQFEHKGTKKSLPSFPRSVMKSL